ncbi:MAG: hypothetical protein LBT74_01670 [Acidobacteriota bacterium]|nr:hypothetical protein [Acidobacteriota bacterium]
MTMRRTGFLRRAAASAAIAVASLCVLVANAHAGESPAGYPLEVEVVTPLEASPASAHPSAGARTPGFGRGNVADGASVRAIDLTGVCDVKVGRLPEGRRHPARWLEPGRRLRLRVEWGMGGESSECDFDAAVRDGVYVEQGGRASLAGQAQLAGWRAAAEAAEREVADRADYTVTLFVLNGNASDAPSRVFGIPSGTFKGFGQGDIFEDRAGHGVHFTYECIGVLQPGKRYPAKWLEGQTRLEVLVPSERHPGRHYLCEAATDVRQEFYVRDAAPRPGCGARHGYIIGVF